MQYSALLTPMTKSSSGGLTPTLLILAGLYQLTPLKHACLKYYRTPVGFLMAEWRDGLGGAVRMGVKHGLYCTGCCCALILLLFAASAMKPIWIVALTIVCDRIVELFLWRLVLLFKMLSFFGFLFE